MKKHAKSLIGLIKEHCGTVQSITGAEVGVWRGELSKDLLAAFPRLTLFMIDPWEHLSSITPTMRKRWDEVVAAREEAEEVTSTYRRVIYPVTSLQAARYLGLRKRRFNFVFVDACHLYGDVKADIDAWLPLVRQNGILAGHDYNGVGDRRLGWGVKRAVDEAFGASVQVLPGNVWWVVKLWA